MERHEWIELGMIEEVRRRAGIEMELASIEQIREYIEMVWACGKNG